MTHHNLILVICPMTLKTIKYNPNNKINNKKTIDPKACKQVLASNF